MNLPFIKFYPRDWQADPELRMCSLESRGLWVELLCVMHSAKRRGFLETPQGQPLTDEQTSRLIGAFKDDLYRCKLELLEHGVPSVEDETGIWYCRRMVKETAKAEKCSASGKKGGGNPSLYKEINKEEEKKPEARSHISLKDTFKGASEQFIKDVESVINCRIEFCGLKPESIATEIHNSEANPRWRKNLDEFLADASNSIQCPKNPLGMLRAYLNRIDQKHKQNERVGTL